MKLIEGGVCAAQGFKAAGIHVGVKTRATWKKDVALIVSDVDCAASAVFTKNVECVGSYVTSRYVNNCRKKLAGHLEHIGDHEKKTLGSSVGSCESTCCKRTVNGTCCTCLRLHFCNLDCCSEDVLETLC